MNELIHTLIIGETAEKTGLKPVRVIEYLKRHRETLENLEAYEVVAEVETKYGLVILGVSAEIFFEARGLIRVHRLLSNDALHLAVMQKEGIRHLVTNDSDFDGIENIHVWKPREK